jgi:hypothetical protein
MSYFIPMPSIYNFLEDQLFNFIFDSSISSKECADQRKHKRNRDEKNMVADIVKDSEHVETSTEHRSPWGKV